MTVAIVRRPTAAAADALAAEGVPPVLARIYAARGIRHATELDHSLSALPPRPSMRLPAIMYRVSFMGCCLPLQVAGRRPLHGV